MYITFCLVSNNWFIDATLRNDLVRFRIDKDTQKSSPTPTPTMLYHVHSGPILKPSEVAAKLTIRFILCLMK